MMLRVSCSQGKKEPKNAKERTREAKPVASSNDVARVLYGCAPLQWSVGGLKPQWPSWIKKIYCTLKKRYLGRRVRFSGPTVQRRTIDQTRVAELDRENNYT